MLILDELGVGIGGHARVIFRRVRSHLCRVLFQLVVAEAVRLDLFAIQLTGLRLCEEEEVVVLPEEVLVGHALGGGRCADGFETKPGEVFVDDLDLAGLHILFDEDGFVLGGVSQAEGALKVFVLGELDGRVVLAQLGPVGEVERNLRRRCFELLRRLVAVALAAAEDDDAREHGDEADDDGGDHEIEGLKQRVPAAPTASSTSPARRSHRGTAAARRGS